MFEKYFCFIIITTIAVQESVELALSILDGALLKGKDVKVEKAHFELKGEYDPSKKPKKMTAQQKKNYLERQKRSVVSSSNNSKYF